MSFHIPIWLMWSASCAACFYMGLRWGIKATRWMLKGKMTSAEWHNFGLVLDRPDFSRRKTEAQ